MLGFRQTLETFEQAGHVQRIAPEVDRQYEVAAVLERLDRAAVALFEQVRGSRLALVGNLLYARRRMAEALGTDESGLLHRLAEAITEGIPPVRAEAAPCQEVVVHEPDIGAELPVPTFFERETGPYITAGVVVARHNLSIARAKLLGGNRLLLGIAPRHHLARQIAEGRPLPVAITLGNAPAVLLASNFYVDYGHDEYAIAGRLFGRGVPVTRARTVDLEVPADSEIVLEATLGYERLDEGPVSEFHGMYESYGEGVVATVSCLTRRQDAIMQTILPGYHAEHMLIGAEAIAATTFHKLRRVVPAVRDVHVPLSGGGRLRAIIAVEKAAPGDERRVVEAAWAHCPLLKQVIVVDTDIEIRDPEQVGYALATRMGGEMDLIVVPGAPTDRSEPLEDGGRVTKFGVVALRRPCGSRSEFGRALVPEAVRRTVADNWHRYIEG